MLQQMLMFRNVKRLTKNTSADPFSSKSSVNERHRSNVYLENFMRLQNGTRNYNH